MRPQTTALAARIRGVQNPEAQLAELTGAYKGETAYVFACGPSIGDVWSKRLNAFLADKLVIAVKQSYALMPEATDFHLFNRCRYQDYAYPDPPPIRMAVEFQPFQHRGDIRMPFWFHPEQRWLHSILFSRALERWDLSRSATRGWGPGLMLELGVFLPVHLGCTRVIFFGWDMNAVDPVHFVEQTITPEQVEEHVVVSNALPQFIPHLNRWFAAHDLRAYLCAPRSAIPLPQLTVDEVMALPGSSVDRLPLDPSDAKRYLRMAALEAAVRRRREEYDCLNGELEALKAAV